MSSKWILLLLTIVLIQSVLSKPNFAEEEEEEEVEETTPTTFHGENDKLLSDYYYRLKNVRFGSDFALDIGKVGTQYLVKVVPVNKKRLGQIWRFVQLEQNVYRIHNYYLKEEYSVDLVGSAKTNKLVMNPTKDSINQKWSVSLENIKDNQIRIFNLFLGENYFLNVFSKTRYAYMNRTRENDFGQFWTLEALDRINE